MTGAGWADGAEGPVTLLPVTGVGEVAAGADLTGLLLRALDGSGPRDGDVLVVTSKVVSKAEGRVLGGDRAGALAGETDRVVARRAATAIVRTRHGFVMANGGVDASNTEAGTVVLLPRDPDGSARRLREEVAARSGANVAVVVTDTAGRAWRHGQTDLAVGAAGLLPLRGYAGREDRQGNPLAVTAPAVADELASAADLVKGKVSGVPAAVVRGLAPLVLPPGRHGAGAAALVREEETDMFGLGAREAVLEALLAADTTAALRGFGAAASSAELVEGLAALGLAADAEGDGVVVRLPRLPERDRGRLDARLHALAAAFGWREDSPGEADAASRRFLRRTP